MLVVCVLFMLGRASTVAAQKKVKLTGAAADSAALDALVRDQLFHYMWTMGRLIDWYPNRRDDEIAVGLSTPKMDSARYQGIRYAEYMDNIGPKTPAPPRLRLPSGSCPNGETIRFDVGQHEGRAHLVKVDARNSACLHWMFPIDSFPPFNLAAPVEEDEGDAEDYALSIDGRVIASKTRAPVLRLLDTVARVLPGDHFVAGQRVRLDIDNGSYVRAMLAADECRAERWWCTMLRGYVEYRSGKKAAASATYDRGVGMMPDSVRCAWSDVSSLLPYEEKQQYREIHCYERESVNLRFWWLSDPLWLEAGNERRAEQFTRYMRVELAAALIIDELWDWRPQYGGLVHREEVLRYGWPTWRPGGRTYNFGAHDTKSIELTAARAGKFQGPQYHTVPSWSAIQSPLSASDSDWDLGPARDGDALWDYSWWAPEFYRRDAGPFLALPYQVAFVRRQQAPLLASQVQWDSAWMRTGPPKEVIAGIALSTSSADMRTYMGRMSGRAPQALLTPITDARTLVGLEMISTEPGAASRTRFAVTPPAALSKLGRGEVALSDPILVRTGVADGAPTSLSAALARMLGSVHLDDPQRLGVYWEVYGLPDGDTVNMSVRMIRHADPSMAERVAALFGLARVSDDTVIVGWKEPRSGDAAPGREGDVTIRPRGVVLEVTAFEKGRYTMEIELGRPGSGVAVALARRELWIRRGSHGRRHDP